MMIREVTIQKASGGFGQYEAVRDNSTEPMDYSDWLSDSDYELQEIKDGVSLATPAEDIRGKVANEPARIFAVWDGKDLVGYAGLDEVEE